MAGSVLQRLWLSACVGGGVIGALLGLFVSAMVWQDQTREIGYLERQLADLGVPHGRERRGWCVRSTWGLIEVIAPDEKRGIDLDRETYVDGAQCAAELLHKVRATRDDRFQYMALAALLTIALPIIARLVYRWGRWVAGP